MEGKGTHFAPQAPQRREPPCSPRGRRSAALLPGAAGQSRAASAPTARGAALPPRLGAAPRRGQKNRDERRREGSSALLRSAPLRAGRAPAPALPCPGLRSGGRCGSLPFCSLAPDKANLLLRSDSATAPCLRPARADVSRSSPRRSIGPAGRGAPAQQALAARHRGPGVSQQSPARAAPLGRRQH